MGRKPLLAATDEALIWSDDRTVVVPGHGVLDDRTGLLRHKQIATDWFATVAEALRESIDREVLLANPKLQRFRDVFVEKSERYETMPENRFSRFLDRTLSADFAVAFPMRSVDLAMFAGIYRTNAGAVITIEVDGGGLVATSPGDFAEQLVPLSPSEFHVRFSLSGLYRFDRDANGQISAFTRIAGDESSTALRSRPR